MLLDGLIEEAMHLVFVPSTLLVKPPTCHLQSLFPMTEVKFGLKASQGHGFLGGIFGGYDTADGIMYTRLVD